MLEKILPWALCRMIIPPQTWPLTENLHLAKAAILMPIPTAHVYYSIALGQAGLWKEERRFSSSAQQTSIFAHF